MAAIIKQKRPKVKLALHPRNKHRERYDLKLLAESNPPLAAFILTNKFNDDSIDFANPEAVKSLNTALIKQYYGITYWDIPEGYLCPAVPGRADYIHHIADLLREHNYGKIPTGKAVRCLDIGTGANCIYPIIGCQEYGWSFVGTDIDPIAIDSANAIIEANPVLKGLIEIRLQPNPQDIFNGIIQPDETFDLTICNPPFHGSKSEAIAGTLRKLNNLNAGKVAEPVLNFGGQEAELWYDGGEEKFLQNMVRQSKEFATSCFWFSSLVSKQSNLDGMNKVLKKVGATAVTTLPMGQGHKVSRVVAWTFLTEEQQKAWRNLRWNAKIGG